MYAKTEKIKETDSFQLLERRTGSSYQMTSSIILISLCSAYIFKVACTGKIRSYGDNASSIQYTRTMEKALGCRNAGAIDMEDVLAIFSKSVMVPEFIFPYMPLCRNPALSSRLLVLAAIQPCIKALLRDPVLAADHD